MSRQQRILCGVPQGECTGGLLKTDQQLGTTKCHASREEAFRCMKRHLLNSGYKQVGSREFQIGNEPILILPKKTKFGGRLRRGKLGDRFQPEENRGVII